MGDLLNLEAVNNTDAADMYRLEECIKKEGDDGQLKTCIQNFRRAEDAIQMEHCTSCNKSFIDLDVKGGRCRHCRQSEKYTAANNMDPGDRPEALALLSPLETTLITPVHSTITISRAKGGQYKTTGHSIQFPVNAQSIVNRLPLHPNRVPLITVRRASAPQLRPFKVRGRMVLDALAVLLPVLRQNPRLRNLEVDSNVENLLLRHSETFHHHREHIVPDPPEGPATHADGQGPHDAVGPDPAVAAAADGEGEEISDDEYDDLAGPGQDAFMPNLSERAAARTEMAHIEDDLNAAAALSDLGEADMVRFAMENDFGGSLMQILIVRTHH